MEGKKIKKVGLSKISYYICIFLKNEGHKVLLFCQTRQMQDILEKFVSGEGYRFLRMDGTTPIKNRQRLVDQFNKSKDVFLFILTTKVGG